MAPGSKFDSAKGETLALGSINAVLGATLLAIGGVDTDASAAPQSSIDVQPIMDARLRYETVEERTRKADALTLRLRGGVVAKAGNLSFLAEAEGTAAIATHYNAFPFALPGKEQWKPTRSVVPDPVNLELNRLQLEYRSKDKTITLGRQRINLDDQRWVGSVGWRQNEQTFDALRGQAKAGPFALDLAYAMAQRTIFGNNAGARTSYKGNFVFAGASAKSGWLEGKAFAYLLDYDEAFVLTNSSQTYGLILSAAIPVSERASLSVRGTYARQSDYASNPFDYSADYWSVDLGGQYAGLSVLGGLESLGSDNGRAVQTPMATLHKFNGWADKFLTTPATGLRDRHLSVSYKLANGRRLKDVIATVTHHRFESASGSVHYGDEWNTSLGMKLGRVGILAKFADYDARNFGEDTRKFWLQAEWSLK